MNHRQFFLYKELQIRTLHTIHSTKLEREFLCACHRERERERDGEVQETGFYLSINVSVASSKRDFTSNGLSQMGSAFYPS